VAFLNLPDATGSKGDTMRRHFVFAVLTMGILAPGVFLAEERQPAAKKAVKPLPLFDVDEFIKEHDKDKDGYLSKAELPERFRHNFALLDLNKDGKISRDELLKGVAYLQPRRRTSDTVFILIEMSDCDESCSGEVQRVYDFLRKLDKNKDGKIDAEELKAGRQLLVEQRVDAIFKALDTNKDGKISRAEARGQVKKHFAKLDLNKDGFVDRKELLTAAMAKHSAEDGKGEKDPAKKPR
jgi:Ca2+-binding EF-hand superfamily protein